MILFSERQPPAGALAKQHCEERRAGERSGAQGGESDEMRGVSITAITSGRLSWAQAFGGRNPLLSDDRPL